MTIPSVYVFIFLFCDVGCYDVGWSENSVHAVGELGHERQRLNADVDDLWRCHLVGWICRLDQSV